MPTGCLLGRCLTPEGPTYTFRMAGSQDPLVGVQIWVHTGVAFRPRVHPWRSLRWGMSGLTPLIHSASGG
eukprot:360458-Chlamydomonas_euryale.AAC.6